MWATGMNGILRYLRTVRVTLVYQDTLTQGGGWYEYERYIVPGYPGTVRVSLVYWNTLTQGVAGVNGIPRYLGTVRVTWDS